MVNSYSDYNRRSRSVLRKLFPMVYIICHDDLSYVRTFNITKAGYRMDIKIISAFVLLITGCYFSYQQGYDARDKLVVSDKLVQAKNEQERQKAQQDIATEVLKGLSDWKENTQTIVENTIHEKTKPVFINICASDDYVRMFNDTVTAAETRLSSNVNAKMPTK